MQPPYSNSNQQLGMEWEFFSQMDFVVVDQPSNRTRWAWSYWPVKCVKVRSASSCKAPVGKPRQRRSRWEQHPSWSTAHGAVFGSLLKSWYVDSFCVPHLLCLYLTQIITKRNETFSINGNDGWINAQQSKTHMVVLSISDFMNPGKIC